MNKLSCSVFLVVFGLLVAAVLGDENTPFTSNPINSCPRTPPTNVADLRPQDIKLFLALGDSVTAGFGIKGLEGGPDEFRGLSGVMGRDEGATSVPTIVGHYSGSMIGSSVGHHFVEFPGKPYVPSKDQLNAAQSGAVAENLAHELEYLLKELPLIAGIENAKDQWKLMNILIGFNDACAQCTKSPRPSVSEATDRYVKYLDAAISTVEQKIPKVVVTVLSTFNLSQVYELSRGREYCKLLHDLPVECPCAYSKDVTERTYLDELLQSYSLAQEGLVKVLMLYLPALTM